MSLSLWAVTLDLDPTLVPASTRALGKGLGLVGGHLRSGADRLEDRRAAVYRVAGDRAAATYQGPGFVVCLDVAPPVAWAVVATLKPEGSGSDYRLLGSTDSGATWRDKGPVPAPSVSTVLAVGRDEVWVLGANHLARSSDGGKSWEPVHAPGERNVTYESLACEKGAVLICGDGVRATRDGGRTWVEHGTEGLRVGAVCGSMVAAYSSAETRLGVVEEKGVRWYSAFEKSMKPFRLAIEGETARFLAIPRGRDRQAGVLLYETADRGKSWDSVLLPCRPHEGAADLGPAGSGIAVDLDGRVLAPTG